MEKCGMCALNFNKTSGPANKGSIGLHGRQSQLDEQHGLHLVDSLGVDAIEFHVARVEAGASGGPDLLGRGPQRRDDALDHGGGGVGAEEGVEPCVRGVDGVGAGVTFVAPIHQQSVERVETESDAVEGAHWDGNHLLLEFTVLGEGPLEVG